MLSWRFPTITILLLCCFTALCGSCMFMYSSMQPCPHSHHMNRLPFQHSTTWFSFRVSLCTLIYLYFHNISNLLVWRTGLTVYQFRLELQRVCLHVCCLELSSKLASV